VTEWWSTPHVEADVRLYRELGVPEEAIRADGSLDGELLRSRGWRLDENSLAPPPECDGHAEPPADRDDGTTWRMSLKLEADQ
jgi:hypothetical protein